MSQPKLEKHPIFPYIAWTTFILFAVFVMHMSLRLQAVADSLQTTSRQLEQTVQQNPNMIRDFDNVRNDPNSSPTARTPRPDEPAAGPQRQ